MAGLEQSRLGDICSVVTDGTHDSPTLQKSGVPFIKGKHISGGTIDFENCDFITPQDHIEACRRVKPQRGDILFSNIGSVGDTAVVMTDREFSIKNVALFRADEATVDPTYLYYLVLSPDFRANVLNVRSGAAQPFISLASLREFKVNFHRDLGEQRRIASILSAYDEMIGNNVKRVGALDAMIRIAYQSLLAGAVPSEVKTVRLGTIAEEVRRNVPKGPLKKPMPYVGLEHLPRRSVALNNWLLTGSIGSNKLRFEKGEVLFGKIRPYFHKVSVAPFDGLCSADTIVIRARRPEHFAVVVAAVSSDAFVAHASATANGAKMPRANWDVLAEYEIALPAGQAAERFLAFVRDAVAGQQVLISQIMSLRRTRDLLLPRFLSSPRACEASVPA